MLKKFISRLKKRFCVHVPAPDGIVPINWDLLDNFHCPVICVKCKKRYFLPNYMFKSWPKHMIKKTYKFNS